MITNRNFNGKTFFYCFRLIVKIVTLERKEKMKSKSHVLITKVFLWFFVIVCAVSSCQGCKKKGNATVKIAMSEKLQKELSSPLATFKSEEEFDKYVDNIFKTSGGVKYESSGAVAYESAPPSAPVAASSAQETTKAEADNAAGEKESESITNVQEAGVDEGDIVKVYKNYLVVLRRGRLFTINLKDKNEPVLKPISRVNAFPEGFSGGTWYDEMLIYKKNIIVVGYSYQMNATEIGRFSINDEGKIAHVSTHFLDSNDYYSSRNYASRLIGNTLIFYMPYYLYLKDHGYDEKDSTKRREVILPGVRKWLKGNETTEVVPVLTKMDIFKPVQETRNPTLHTVVMCDLDSPGFDCKGKAVLGPYSRNFYVSPNAIYVWVSPEYWYGGYYESGNSESSKPKEPPTSFVYMILLQDGSARALRAYGAPVDQFSFKEDSRGYLNVVVRESGFGEAMWNPEFTSGKLALIRTSLKNFTDDPKIIPVTDYKILPTPKGYEFQNRFVGDYLFYGTGSGWYYDKGAENRVYVFNYITKGDVQQINLSHSCDRIEVMGNGAVVIGVGEDNKSLRFSSFDLRENTAELMDTYSVTNVMQGELRSHGFFYKPTGEDEGVLGLPVRREEAPSMHLVRTSAEVLFLRVERGKHFHELGSLVSKVGEVNDNCVASCVDWYGNSRPIFLGDRIIALMGYELVEGIIENNEIKEVNRVNFLNADSSERVNRPPEYPF